MRIQGLTGAYRCTRRVAPLLVVLALAASTVSSSILCGRWDPAIRRREGSGPSVCVSPRVASGFPGAVILQLFWPRMHTDTLWGV